MANIDFLINGKRVNSVSGADGFNIIYSLDESTGTISAAASAGLELNGSDHCDLHDLFFGDCSGISERADVTVETECTDPLEFEITAEGISHCIGEKQSTLNLERRTDEDCFRRIQDTVYWKGGWLEAVENGTIEVPKVFYCVQGSTFVSALLFVLRSILLPILLVLEVVELIANFLSGPFGTVNIPSLDNFDNLITGCGRYHHAPLVRDIVAFHVERCDMTFQSSILVDDPIYRNTAILEAAIHKGTKSDIDRPFKYENSFNLTVGQILDQIKEPFNAEWRIIDDVLYFERKDFFDDRREVELVDVEAVYPSNADGSACYTFNSREACAFWRGEYSHDSLDTQGNRVLDVDHGYKDLVEWNDPPEEWQKGECPVSPQFGGARFMFDRITCEDDGTNDTVDRWLDIFRSNKIPVVLGTLGYSRKHALIMERHEAAFPKLLILEIGYNPNDSRVIRREFAGSPNDYTCHDYNYPMYFNENYEVPELYQRFHAIDNPRDPDNKYDHYLISQFTYAPDDFCEAVRLIHNQFHDLYVNTAFGRGIPSRYTVDFDNCTISIEDIRIRCSTT